MSDDEITNVKSRLLDVLADLGDEELEAVEEWISSQSYKNELKTKKALQKSEKQLKKISDTLKKLVPFDAVMPSESIAPPTVGDKADCADSNTCHVDEFLYDGSEVDKLVLQGKLKRHYCLDCHSRNIEELTFISHSLSRQALLYIFKVLLPRDLSQSTVLDVGSRLGAVLFGAYYFSNASPILGVEMNKECCEIQQEMIQKFCLDPQRVKVVHADVTERSDLVQSANVIIINIPDFFLDTEKHKEMWYFLKKNIRKGTYLVTTRSMASTLGGLGIFEDLMDWLTISKPNQLENEMYFDIVDCSELFLYLV